MRKAVIFLLIMFCSSLIFAEKTGELLQVLRPQNLEVGGNRLYVSEGAEIHVFSLKDLSLICRFGKKGEGPGELQVNPFIANNITEYPAYLFVQAFNKILYFNHDGNFVREQRKVPSLFRILPVGKNFIVNKIVPGEKQQQISVAAIHDAQLKEIKELCRQEVSTRGSNMFMAADTIQFAVYKDKVYLENSKKGFVIEVYDQTGALQETIKKEIPPLTLTDNHRNELIEDLKNDPLAAAQIKNVGSWEEYKKLLNLHWPRYSPPIRDIVVSGNRIYLQTFNTREREVEFVVLAIDGQEIKRVFLPRVKEPSLLGRLVGRGTRLFDIEEDKYYYLYENEDEEVWELHVKNI